MLLFLYFPRPRSLHWICAILIPENQWVQRIAKGQSSIVTRCILHLCIIFSLNKEVEERMESSAISLNSLPVIPPIASGINADNGFLNCMNDWVAKELLKVDPTDPEQCYHVHKEAFNEVSHGLWV